MERSSLGVRASAGSLRDREGDPAGGDAVVLPHAWTTDGVLAAPAANGAHLFHLSVAFCVLNDTYREAANLGIEVRGVMVEADGAFDSAWSSTGVEYAVTVDSPASPDDVARLLGRVDEVAEIPRAVRAGATVTRRRD